MIGNMDETIEDERKAAGSSPESGSLMEYGLSNTEENKGRVQNTY